MMEFLFRVWLTSVVLTIPFPWIEDALKPRNKFYMGTVVILVTLDIGLLFVMAIMAIWGIK